MYFLIEDAPKGSVKIIGEFYCIKDAESKMIQMEALNDIYGCYCNYSITKLVSATEELNLIK